MYIVQYIWRPFYTIKILPHTPSQTRGTCTTEQYDCTILRRKKDGDWYIYPWFLAHESLNVYKNSRKINEIFKPRLHNVITTGTNIANVWLPLCLIGCVRFAWYCGKMYNRHLFLLWRVGVMTSNELRRKGVKFKLLAFYRCLRLFICYVRWMNFAFFVIYRYCLTL